MEKYRAAAAGDPRPGVVIKLDDEIVEMVVAFEPVPGRTLLQANRSVVAPVMKVFAPGILGSDRANGKESAWPCMTVRAPPEPTRLEGASWRAAIALPFVGQDAGAPECDGNGQTFSGQPTAVRIDCSADSDSRYWPVGRGGGVTS